MVDFHVAIIKEGMEIVVGHDIWGYVTNGDAHVRIVAWLHGCAKVEILDVTHHAAPASGGNNTVEEELSSDEVSSFGADIAGIFHMVTTNSPLDMMGHGLFGPMCTDNV